jgi:serine/threonine-protein kinase
MVGRTLAQYRIEQRLGKGGMGAVYRAFDTRLKRNVAVNILTRSEESEDELARLLAEARAAAALNHPAIATIYEVGEAEGVCFIVM